MSTRATSSLSPMRRRSSACAQVRLPGQGYRMREHTFPVPRACGQPVDSDLMVVDRRAVTGLGLEVLVSAGDVEQGQLNAQGHCSDFFRL